MKLFYTILFVIAVELSAQVAVKISPASESYIDPEILNKENLITFQTGTGDVWVAKLNPLTGLFLTASGKDYLVDQNAANPSQTLNGPEFGYDNSNWSLFFTKPYNNILQIWKAELHNESFISMPLKTGNQRRQTALVSKNYSTTSTRVLYILGSLKDGTLAWADSKNPSQETVIDSVDKGIRWIEGTNKLVYVKQTGNFKGELCIYDTDSKSEKIITNDKITKSFPFAWFAPEYKNELVAVVMLDGDKKLGFYKETGNGFWELILELSVPDSSPYSYFGSPEPFIAAGKSYISCVIKEKAESYSPSEVWIIGIQQGKNKSYARKIEDGLGIVVRTDPETFIGENEVFIYYNVLINNQFELYRSRTGLITLNRKELTTHIILPQETDTAIDGHNEPNYVLLDNSKEKINKLLLFFPGTNARPYDYLKFGKTAAEMGYHVINLSYENNESINIDICPQTKDTTCHHRARYEIWFGEDKHDKINVNYPNSIINRLTRLLIYLSQHYPNENWKQFLLDNKINWKKIVTAGHSQGGGHAGFGSKYFKVDKSIMIAATDWVGGQTADWIRMTGPTPDDRYFGFIHTLDVPIYNTIGITWRDYGMLKYGMPVDTDTEPYPFKNSHSLTTSLQLNPGTIGHNFPIVDFETPSNNDDYDNYLYSSVWRYLLEASTSTSVKNFDLADKIPIDFLLFQNHPNPFNPSTVISYQISAFSYVTLKVYDVLGREVSTLVDEVKQPGSYSTLFSPGSAGQVLNSTLSSGVYFYQLKVTNHSAGTAQAYIETKKMMFLK